VIVRSDQGLSSSGIYAELKTAIYKVDRDVHGVGVGAGAGAGVRASQTQNLQDPICIQFLVSDA